MDSYAQQAESEMWDAMARSAPKAKRYVVIEHTPGYLSEDDDPAVFDDLAEARVYASDRLSSLLDHIVEGQENDEGFTVHGSFQDDLSVLVYDKSRMHDLGRVIEIAEHEEGL